MSHTPETPASNDARQVLDTWDRLASTHVPVSGGCSCGRPHVALTLRDFEQDIADYLQIEAEKYQRRDVNAFLVAHARVGERWSVAHLLAKLTDQQTITDSGIADFLLPRLARTIKSFETLHGRH